MFTRSTVRYNEKTGGEIPIVLVIRIQSDIAQYHLKIGRMFWKKRKRHMKIG